jgi:hypothetical protein
VAASSLPTEMTDYRWWRHRCLTSARSAGSLTCGLATGGALRSVVAASQPSDNAASVCQLTAVKWRTTDPEPKSQFDEQPHCARRPTVDCRVAGTAPFRHRDEGTPTTQRVA